MALGWASLVKPLIAQKRLAKVIPLEITAPQSFYLTWPKRQPLSHEAEVLRDWLLALND